MLAQQRVAGRSGLQATDSVPQGRRNELTFCWRVNSAPAIRAIARPVLGAEATANDAAQSVKAGRSHAYRAWLMSWRFNAAHCAERVVGAGCAPVAGSSTKAIPGSPPLGELRPPECRRRPPLHPWRAWRSGADAMSRRLRPRDELVRRLVGRPYPHRSATGKLACLRVQSGDNTPASSS